MYIIIPQTTVDQYQGTESPVNANSIFNARQTTAGEWVVDENTECDFPDAFTGTEVRADLSVNDFPPEVLKPLATGRKK